MGVFQNFGRAVADAKAGRVTTDGKVQELKEKSAQAKRVFDALTGYKDCRGRFLGKLGAILDELLEGRTPSANAFDTFTLEDLVRVMAKHTNGRELGKELFLFFGDSTAVHKKKDIETRYLLRSELMQQKGHYALLQHEAGMAPRWYKESWLPLMPQMPDSVIEMRDIAFRAYCGKAIESLERFEARFLPQGVNEVAYDASSMVLVHYEPRTPETVYQEYELMLIAEYLQRGRQRLVNDIRTETAWCAAQDTLYLQLQKVIRSLQAQIDSARVTGEK